MKRFLSVMNYMILLSLRQLLDMSRCRSGKTYDLYVQMIEEVQDMFPQKEYRKDCKKLEHNRKLYEDLLKYREEHRWNQNKDVKE